MVAHAKKQVFILSMFRLTLLYCIYDDLEVELSPLSVVKLRVYNNAYT